MKSILSNKPLISIIIRTKNEERWIESCVQNIINQSYKKVEIIIVDNNSTDKTLYKIKKYKLKIVKINNFLPGKAINTGIKKSKGKIIVCLSAHCIPVNKKWLENTQIILEEVDRNMLHGMIHCSGGAQTKILHFIDNLHIVKDNMFELPPLFKLIQKESNTDWREMYQVFNMGHRMELYVDPKLADQIVQISESFNIPAQVIGRVEASEEKRLTIKKKNNQFQLMR